MSGWAGACFRCTGRETMLTMSERAPFAGSADRRKSKTDRIAPTAQLP
jgi:hypothetical protein